MVDPFEYTHIEDEIDAQLPKVLVLISDNVRLIRNNSVPMLQAQVEIITDSMMFDSQMSKLGLNDVIYLVPEFTPSEYE